MSVAATLVHRHQHTPRVRRLAAESGLALTGLKGTGPRGRVTPEDVRLAATSQDAVDQPLHMDAPGGRQHLTSVMEIDVTAIVSLCERLAPGLRETRDVPLTRTSFYAKAVLEALRAHPALGTFQHLGIAVETPNGLVVPVLKDAGDLNLVGLSRRLSQLADRARAGSLSVDELAAGTFTLTDAASRGVLWDTPILVPGQVAHLGTGAVVERAVVVRRPDAERVIAIRSMVHFALTYDGRAADAADAARFLTFVKDRLEAGSFDSEVN